MDANADTKKTPESVSDHTLIRLPLLDNHQLSSSSKPHKTPARKVVKKAFKDTANLANLLPTGTVLIFHLLSPILTHDGKCSSGASKIVTLALLGACAIACFVQCFTDSFRDERGKVRYVLATFQGMVVIDGSGAALPPEEAWKFRIRFVDSFHAWMSVVVFAAVAMSDENVIHCFFPSPSVGMTEVVTAVPVVVGTICSALFVVFPSKRHGIGFPISRD